MGKENDDGMVWKVHKALVNVYTLSRNFQLLDSRSGPLCCTDCFCNLLESDNPI